MTADWVVAELYKIAAANMADYMRSTPQGDPYLDFSALSRDQTTALSEVTVDDYVDARGEDAREVKRVKFKLHDKLLRARRSLRPLHPERLGQDRLAAYRDHGADRIVAEINNGGEMVEATLRVIDENVAYTGVHASRGKVVRAEPVAALYEHEEGRIHHMVACPQLEDQMCEFTPDLDRSKPKLKDPSDPAASGKGKRLSPDRVDALVWAFTELLVEQIANWGIYETTRRRAEAPAQSQKPQPTQTVWAIGSMELHAEQNKSS